MKKLHRNITKHGINMVLLPIFMQRETYRNMVVNMDKPAFMQRENYRNMMVNMDYASPVHDYRACISLAAILTTLVRP